LSAAQDERRGSGRALAMEDDMGLLDGLLGGDGASGEAVNAIGGLLQNHEGGLGGLVGAFEQGGLGEIAKSWVGTGQNLPISADQIQSVLGSGMVAQFAQKLGIEPQQAAGQLANILPQVIDQLTPNGHAPEGGLGGMLGGLMGKLNG
jgi:uncharacterized protein YidB (DUF937 family)